MRGPLKSVELLNHLLNAMKHRPTPVRYIPSENYDDMAPVTLDYQAVFVYENAVAKMGTEYELGLCSAANGALGANKHVPMFDLDVPAYLIPSSTPGHSHLYIDAAITTEQYARILEALCSAGLVQVAWAEKVGRPHGTLLRAPGQEKAKP